MGPNDEPLSEEECRAIEVHKWFLSQQAGRDVGWEFAVEDWKQYHQAEWRNTARKVQLLCNYEQAKEIRDYIWLRSEEAGQDLSQKAEEEWVQLYASEWRQKAEKKVRKSIERAKDLKLESESSVYGQPFGAEWRHVKVRNEKGLHVRPSMCLKKLLDEYKDVDIYVHNVATNGGAIQIAEMTDILCLGAICGDILLFGAKGDRAEKLLDEIERLFDDFARNPF